MAYFNEETGEVIVDPYSFTNETGSDYKLFAVTCDVHEQAQSIEGMTNFTFQIFDSSQNVLFDNKLNNTQQMQDLYVLQNGESLCLTFLLQSMNYETAKALIGKPGIRVSLSAEKYSPTTYKEITFSVNPAEAGTMDSTPIQFEAGDAVTYLVSMQTNKIEFTIESTGEVITKKLTLDPNYIFNGFTFTPALSEEGIIKDSVMFTANCAYNDKTEPKAVYTYEDQTLTFYYDNKNYDDVGHVYNISDNTQVNSSDIKNIQLPTYYSGSSTISYISPVTKVVIADNFKEWDTNKSLSGWFSIGYNFPIIYEGLENINTANVENFYAMFGDSMFNTSSMQYSLDLTGLKLDSKDISYMFNYNNSLSYLTFGKSNLAPINVDYLFNQCQKLRKLDMSALSSKNLKSYENMFSECVPNSIAIGADWEIPLSNCGLPSYKKWRAPDGNVCTTSEIFTGTGGKGAGVYTLEEPIDFGSHRAYVWTQGAGEIVGPSDNIEFNDRVSYSINQNNQLILNLDSGTQKLIEPVAKENFEFICWMVKKQDTSEEYITNSNYNGDITLYNDVEFTAVFTSYTKVTMNLDGGSVNEIPEGWLPDAENNSLYYKYYDDVIYYISDFYVEWSECVFTKDGYVFSGFDCDTSKSYDHKDIVVVWARPDNVFVWDVNSLDLQQDIGEDGIERFDTTHTKSITLKNCSIVDSFYKRSIKLNTNPILLISYGLINPTSNMVFNNSSGKSIEHMFYYCRGSYVSPCFISNGEYPEYLWDIVSTYWYNNSIASTNIHKLFNHAVTDLQFFTTTLSGIDVCYIQDKIIVTFGDSE